MYKVGDLILYGTTGVCRVMDIAPQDLSGKGGQQLYYFLKPFYQDCMISTPVDSDKVFTRPVISREEAEQLIDLIPQMQTRDYSGGAVRELTERYEAAIRSHNCRDLVELIMSIYAKKQTAQLQKRKFGAVDERFMKRAEDLLYGELGVALGIEKDAVPDYIAQRVDGGKGRQAQ